MIRVVAVEVVLTLIVWCGAVDRFRLLEGAVAVGVVVVGASGVVVRVRLVLVVPRGGGRVALQSFPVHDDDGSWRDGYIRRVRIRERLITITKRRGTIEKRATPPLAPPP